MSQTDKPLYRLQYAENVHEANRLEEVDTKVIFSIRVFKYAQHVVSFVAVLFTSICQANQLNKLVPSKKQHKSSKHMIHSSKSCINVLID